MSDVLQKQLEDLRTELTEARLANETMKQEMEAQNTEAIQNQLQKFEETISAKDEAISAKSQEIEDALARVNELEEALSGAESAKEEAVAKIAEIEKAAAIERRISALTQAGVEEEEIEETLAQFESLDDSTFDFIVAKMYKKDAEKENPFAKKDKKEDEEAPAKAEDELLEEEIDESEAVAEDLDEVEVEEDVAMAEAVSEEDPTVELRATASDWFGSLLKSTANLK